MMWKPSRFKDLSIRTKLTTGFVLALLLFVGVSLVGLFQLQQLNRASHETTEVWLPEIQILSQLKKASSEHRLLATLRTRTTDFRQLAEIVSGLEDTSTDIASLVDRLSPNDQVKPGKSLLKEFKRSWSIYEATLDEIFRKLERGDIASAIADFEKTSLDHYTTASEKINQLLGQAYQQSNQAAQNADRVYRNSILLFLFSALTGCVFVLVGTIRVTQKVSTPLDQIATAMEKLANGEVSEVLDDGSTRNDEIGKLLKAYAGYRESLLKKNEFAKLLQIEHSRLRTAMSNMPAGLAMFDSDGWLIISNDLYGKMYRLPERLMQVGVPAHDIGKYILKDLGLAERTQERVLGELAERSKSKTTNFHTRDFVDGRTIAITFQPIPAGGWLEIHEDVTDRQKDRRKIEHLAKHDALTGLPNRIMLSERTTKSLQEVRAGEALGFLCLDLDFFKDVNDTLGHPTGDALLKLVAERLRNIVRDTDTIARIGGDEFVVVQHPSMNKDETAHLAKRIIDKVSEPYFIDGHEINIAVSIGIATAPKDGSHIEELLKKGDIALYRSKEDGRGKYWFFEPEMDVAVQSRRQLEIDIRRAFNSGELTLNYQPIFDLATNRVAGFEALIRWPNRKRSEIPSMEFISAAERAGIIHQLGDWVLMQACQDASKWPKNASVAINVAQAQCKNLEFYDSVKAALDTSGLDPTRLQVEITEGVLISEHASTIQTLNKLKALGIKMVMDDFGTGYSSLSYLQRFPFDRIKIDASFVHDVTHDKNARAILHATAQLGAELGMSTTAEGVESEEQLQLVKQAGCTTAQGYYFSKAMPASEIQTYLKGFEIEDHQPQLFRMH